MEKMITIDAAFNHYDATLQPLSEELVSIDDARDRVLTRDATSRTALPPFPQSAMDGYALRSEDVADASASHPVRLSLAGEVPATVLDEAPSLSTGEAVRIFTGGHVPEGADAVLRQEDAQVEGDELVLTRAIEAGRDVRPAGEEVSADAVVVEAGTRLSYRHVAALAVSGIDSVPVHRRPRVAAFTTGDEIVEPGQALKPGQVYDANTPLVTGWLRSQGLTEIEARALPDTLAGTESALRDAFAWADWVITTGGVSVGEYDFVIPAAEQIGMAPVFWKVRQKPGKPLFFAVMNGKALLGLPGNPGSAFACLVTHGRRVLDLFQGATVPGPSFGMGRLAEPVQTSAEREWWARCRVSYAAHGDAWLEVLPRQASHMIANLGQCQALARMPMGERGLERGHPVPWTPVDG